MTNDPFKSRLAPLEHICSVLGPPSEADLANPTGSVAQFATELKTSSGVLIEQLEAAGIKGLGPNDQVTVGDKQALLEALKARSSHEPRPSETLYHQKIVTPDQLIFAEAISDQLLTALANNPQLMYELEPRKFEELVARMFTDYGFHAQLTPATRDGGYDIIATLHNPATSFIALIECKKYSPDNRVGVEIVRGLYGVTEMKGANQGLVVTSSSFTRGALEEKARIGSRMELKDYAALTSWLHKYIGTSQA